MHQPRWLALAAVTGMLASAPVSIASVSYGDIETYSLFGLESVSVKGRNVHADRGFITGDVGVNRAEPNNNNWLLNLGANGVVVMADWSKVVADSVRADNASVYDLFVNRLNKNSPADLRGTMATLTSPVIAGAADWTTFTISGDLPAFPFTPNRGSTNSALSVTVPKGDTVTLAPGVYGDIQVNDNAVLNLEAGLYDLRNFNTGKGVVVTVTDDTILQIAEVSFWAKVFLSASGRPPVPRCSSGLTD